MGQKMSAPAKIQMAVKIPKNHEKCRAPAYPKTDGKVSLKGEIDK